MKKMFLFVPLVFCLLFIAGCQETAKKDISNRIAVESGGKFPKFLVGTWHVQDPNQVRWEFTFEANGAVSSLKNFLNTYIIVSEGGTLEKGADPNETYAVTTLGPVDVDYEPQSRTLTVKVVTESFIIHSYDAILEGNSVDIFTGAVSKDEKIWKSNWLNYTQIKEAQELDPNQVKPTELVFKKRE